MPAVTTIDEYLEETDCLGCGGSGHVPIGPVMPDSDIYGEPLEPYASMLFQFVQCTSCSTVYLRRRVRQEELGYFYNGEYHCYHSYDDRGFIFKTLAGMLTRAKTRAIEPLFPSDQRVLLDYGCGAGVWLDLLRRSGVDWKLIGTEISPSLIEIVRSQGFEGHVCTEQNLHEHVPKESVGVIHLFHVIEHLPDPVGALSRLADSLEPGGAIFGQTPNLASWDRHIFGEDWVHWHPPRHLILYTPETLRLHAEAAGLEVKSISSSMAAATGWSNSLEKWACARMNREFMPSSSPLYPFLTLAAIPLTVFQAMVSWTGAIDFIFVKPR